MDLTFIIVVVVGGGKGLGLRRARNLAYPARRVRVPGTPVCKNSFIKLIKGIIFALNPLALITFWMAEIRDCQSCLNRSVVRSIVFQTEPLLGAYGIPGVPYLVPNNLNKDKGRPNKSVRQRILAMVPGRNDIDPLAVAAPRSFQWLETLMPSTLGNGFGFWMTVLLRPHFCHHQELR